MSRDPSIEDVRSYWDSRPCNIRHSASAVGSREYFDEVEARKYFVEPHIPGFANFPEWAGKRVLEVGCGIGTDAVNFARAGADYWGMELSETSLALTKQRFDLYALKGTLLHGNAEAPPTEIPEQYFDLIYSFGVLHHTPKPIVALRALRRHMKSTGELRIMLYASDSWKAAMIRAGLDQPEAQSGCPIAYTYDRYGLERLLADAGFVLLEASKDHVFPYVIESYLRHEYVRQPWFEAMPRAVFRALETELGWHWLVRAAPSTRSG